VVSLFTTKQLNASTTKHSPLHLAFLKNLFYVYGMRTLMILLTLNLPSICIAQETYPHFPTISSRGRVVLMNDEKIQISGIRILEPDSALLYIHNSVTEHRKIPVSNIKIITKKSRGIGTGAGVGLIVGAGIGYLVGALGYDRDPNQSDEDNRSDRNVRGIIGAIPGGIGGAATGFVIGTVFFKKRFAIYGNKTRLNKALNKFRKDL